MKRSGLLLLSTMAFSLFVGSAFAQGRSDFYYVTYFSNANTVGAPDAVLRLVNDGDASTGESAGKPNGNLYASIYVFGDGQDMQECCNCSISADGLFSESVNINLTSNTLTGRLETSRGVIKILGSKSNDPTNNVLMTGLRGTLTHIQSTSNIPSVGPFYVTESPVANAVLAPVEKGDLEQTCGFVITLGSGYGVCSCTPEDHDF